MDYILRFDLSPLDALDNHALLACQPYNYGDSTGWFLSFRGGLIAVRLRVHAVRKHYLEVHSWTTEPRALADAEYHLASIFFNMDSALECLVFALNALGNAVEPSLFRDVTDAKSLRAVSPTDVCSQTKVPLPGYIKYFPKFQKLWLTRLSLIDEIREQHDVSKHRETIFEGGQVQTDPPPGFYEVLGIAGDPMAQMRFQPMAEIILRPDPKAPNIARGTGSPTPNRLLEDLAIEFVDLLNISAILAAEDAKANISLIHTSFLR